MSQPMTVKDQEASTEFARELKAQPTGIYRLSDDERAAIQQARRDEFLPDAEMDEYWKRHEA
jgi:hypothetical protein